MALQRYNAARLPRHSRVNQFTVVVLICLSVTSLYAEDPLNEFQHVVSYEHIDTELGFKLSIPYEWQPGRNPITESNFYVGSPFGLPSFWINSFPATESTDIEAATSDGNLGSFPGHRIESQDRIEIAGVQALKTTLKWTTQDAGRHFVQTDIIAFLAEGRMWVLVSNQFDRETQWTPKLNNLIDSFELLNAS